MVIRDKIESKTDKRGFWIFPKAPFCAIRPSSGRGKSTSGHLTAKCIERLAAHLLTRCS